MPFPLAHPVAVLPFRRWCPRRLSLVGLVVGSITPDLGYALRQSGYPLFHLDWSDFTHSLPGSVMFCLPAGWIAARVVFLIRQPLAETLPAPHRDALVPLCAGPLPAWWRLGISVLMGAWTHLVFDGLTHESAVRAMARSAASDPFAWPAAKRFYQVLWILVSLISLGWLGWTYIKFLRRSTGTQRLLNPGERRRVMLWAGLLGIPYAIVVPFSLRMFAPGGPFIDWHTIYASLQPYLLLLTAVVTVFGLARKFHTRKVPPP